MQRTIRRTESRMPRRGRAGASSSLPERPVARSHESAGGRVAGGSSIHRGASPKNILRRRAPVACADFVS
eukprot:COSAG03_NODE_5142_length_1331_cov_4.674513_3_plen_69_part_01